MLAAHWTRCFAIICMVAAALSIELRAAELVIRVHAATGINTGVLQAAQHQAAAALSSGGVATTWINCTGAERPLRCDGSRAPGEVILRVVDIEQRDDGAIGYATPREGRWGGHATVFEGGVREISERFSVGLPALLGHAMAHEIGHLVLGFGQHSRRGLMRADWSPADLRRMHRGGLHFTDAQRRLIEERWGSAAGGLGD